jgi:glycosyltransferase involved in cell wall biosynthesis
MRNLRSEDEITRTWSKVFGEPVVSVCCITYNHEQYIEDALAGFLMQETDFTFEVVVHDDASTDGTAEIIKRYEARYPKIIRAIYQTNNQYSQGVKVSTNFVLPVARGEYLALCEGDDYWIHPKKLAMQLDSLKKHDADIVFNPSVTEVFNANGQITKTVDYGYWGTAEVKLSLEDVFTKGGGAIPAASILIRRSALLGNSRVYEEFLKRGLSHFYWQVFGAMRSGAVYLPVYMTTYRRGVVGSWTQANRDPVKKLKNTVDFLDRIGRFNMVTQRRYQVLVRNLRFRKMVSALRTESVASRDKAQFFSEVGASRVERYMVSSMLFALNARTFFAQLLRLKK